MVGIERCSKPLAAATILISVGMSLAASGEGKFSLARISPAIGSEFCLLRDAFVERCAHGRMKRALLADPCASRKRCVDSDEDGGLGVGR